MNTDLNKLLDAETAEVAERSINTKSEYRNPKQMIITKLQKYKTMFPPATAFVEFKFEVLNLFDISFFMLRILLQSVIGQTRPAFLKLTIAAE